MRRLAILLLSLLFFSCASARSGFVPVDGGGRLFYTDEGRGDAVVLLHGGFMDLRMWEPQVAALAREYRVIRYDMRGYGRSPATAAHDPATDFARLLDHLGIERAHVVGLSMGGSHAIDFALARPDRVRSLVVAEPGLSGHQWSDDVIGTMRAVRKTFQEEGRDAAIRTFMERPVFASARDKPQAWRTIREQLHANFSMQPKPMKQLDPPAIGRLGEIKVPVLVLVSSLGGPDSRVIRDAILQNVPAAKQALVENSGHMINLEQPERFNALLLDFLRSQ